MDDSNEKALRRDMALAARDLLGSGYIDSYYYDVSSDFVAVAQWHIAAAVAAALEVAS